MLAAGSSFVSAVAEAAGQVLPDVVVVVAVPIFDSINAVLEIVGIEEGERADFELMFAEELAVITTKGLRRGLWGHSRQKLEK